MSEEKPVPGVAALSSTLMRAAAASALNATLTHVSPPRGHVRQPRGNVSRRRGHLRSTEGQRPPALMKRKLNLKKNLEMN